MKNTTFDSAMVSPATDKIIWAQQNTDGYTYWPAEKLWQTSLTKIDTKELICVALHWLQEDQGIRLTRREFNTFLWLVIQKDLVHGQKCMAEYDALYGTFRSTFTERNPKLSLGESVVQGSVETVYGMRNFNSEIQKIKSIHGMITSYSPWQSDLENQTVMQLRQYYKTKTNAWFEDLRNNPYKSDIYYQMTLDNYSFDLRNELTNIFLHALFLVRAYGQLPDSINQFHHFLLFASMPYHDHILSEPDFGATSSAGIRWYPGNDKEKQAIINFFNF